MKNLINGQKPEFGNLDQIKFLQSKERVISDDLEYKIMRKNMNPLEKAIDDLANIGWSHFAIDNLVKLVTEKLSGRSPMDIAIDKATGYEKGIIKGFIIILRGHYKELVKNYRRAGDEKAVCDYKELINKIDINLKGDFKDIKQIEL